MKPSLRKRAVSIVADLMSTVSLNKRAQKRTIDSIHNALLNVRRDTLKDARVSDCCIITCFDARNHRFCTSPVVTLSEKEALVIKRWAKPISIKNIKKPRKAYKGRSASIITELPLKARYKKIPQKISSVP